MSIICQFFIYAFVNSLSFPHLFMYSFLHTLTYQQQCNMACLTSCYPSDNVSHSTKRKLADVMLKLNNTHYIQAK